MAIFVFNVSKGRSVEFYNRVKSADPATCGFIITLLKTAGLVSDATLKDYASLQALLAGASDESDIASVRKTLVAADIAALTIDNTNDRVDLVLPNQTWVAATGAAVSKLLVCFATDTGGSDAQILPMTAHDFVKTPDASDIVTNFAAAGFFRAS